MATSARDLLEELHQHTAHHRVPVDSTRAADALTAADTLGRVLDWLAADGVHTDRHHPRSHAVHGLARAVRHLSPHPPSPAMVRLTDLAGAAADLTALQRDNYNAAERWSTAVAVAEAIQTCVDYARRRPDHYDAGIYQTIHNAAAAVAQLAAADPPDPLRRTLLDTQAPAPASPHSLAFAANAAPALAIAVRQAHRHGGITLADGLASIAASYTATHYGQLVALAAEQRDDQDVPDSDPSWRYAARAWQQVHRSLNAFDDGTRIRHTSATAIATAAIQLHHGLRDLLGVDANTSRLSGRPDLAETATALRQIVNHLPVIADQLTRAVAHWGGTGQLTALASNLPHSGRSLDAYLHRRIVTVDLSDLTPTLTALRHAHTLAIHLAGELHHSAGKIGAQPQPYLAQSYRLQQPSITGQEIATLIATDAAVTPRRPWHAPTRSRAR